MSTDEELRQLVVSNAEAVAEICGFQKIVIERFDKIDSEISQLREELRTEVKRWDEQFFQLARDMAGSSRTIIIAAASVVIFGSVLDKADVLLEGIAKLLGK